MKTYLVLGLFVMSLISCKEDEDCCTNIDAGVGIYVLDEDGNDLLNPENKNSIGHSDINISYVVGDQVVEVNNPNMDTPKGFLILEPEGSFSKYRLGLTLNTVEDDVNTITFIDWFDSKRDTIKSNIVRSENSIICTKIWFNESLVWDVNDPNTWQSSDGLRFFEISIE